MTYLQDADGYVNFGDVSRSELSKQCQYGSRYVDGSDGYPNLSEGLRFRNLDKDYHDIQYTLMTSLNWCAGTRNIKHHDSNNPPNEKSTRSGGFHLEIDSNVIH